MSAENNIEKLLRLKRYEQPPPEYFDQFLRDFQRRQRCEMLRQPLWKLVLERTQAFFGEHSLGHHTHAFAMAVALLLVGLAALNVMMPSSEPNKVARIEPSTQAKPEDLARVSLNTTASKPDLRTAAGQSTVKPDSQAIVRPYYVIDTRPVSYEPPFSF